MICNTFQRLASSTWDKIAQSRNFNFQLKEETFTDLNMLDIKASHPLRVRTKVFTKHEEGSNGADWEWWFRDAKNQWIGFRVQAKILNITSDEFEHLHYQSFKTKVFQCDKLIQKALIGPTPTIPLYCFYIQSDNQALLTKWHCQTFPDTRHLWGCSLTSAFNVRSLRVNATCHLSNLEPYLKPWHCLVCCKGYGGDSAINDISNYADVNYNLDNTVATELGLAIPDSFITNKPPQHVLATFENENNDNIFVDDPDLRGVLIYTFDKEDEK